MMTSDEIYMRRCLELATKGRQTTPPNPMVGSVIVYKGEIIGEGYHIKAGQPHAEINAINSVKDKTLLKSSTLYVNLEPCSHYGKTPPCAVKIAELGIPRVVIGVRDYSSKVNGKGIRILKESGVDVREGVLEKEAFDLNKRFFVNQLYNRPYIILKWAKTADNLIDYTEKSEAKVNWITNDFSRMLVHKWRAEETAILIGKNTVIRDNPSLTVREWYSHHQPVRIILTTEAKKLSGNYTVFDGKNKTLLVVTNQINKNLKGAEIVEVKGMTLDQIMQMLYFRYNIYSIIVEGGLYTLNKFIEKNLWDEARVFTGTKVIFGKGIKAPELNAYPQYVELREDVLLEYYFNKIEILQ
jgi:diaminohydroxyphosphoribosylaminopyrimidine deaminase/5-amino-6-(5-phosphoribosylamino)uracil reductase